MKDVKITNRMITLVNCLISNIVCSIVVIEGLKTDPKFAMATASILAVFYPVILRITKVSSFEFDADDHKLKLVSEQTKTTTTSVEVQDASKP